MLDDFKANAKADVAARERLSALLDGELDGHAVTLACVQWRESAESRATWHAYHLIGDVLRSDDLASHPVRDSGFLDALRARLATEPVVLAPQPLNATAAVEPHAARSVRRWQWIAPGAVAAGFVAVVGVLTLTRPNSPPERNDATSSVAQAAAPTSLAGGAAVGVGNPAGSTPEPQALVATGQLIRDARLDRYLTAHKQFAGSSALGVPSAYLRNATADASGR